MRERNPDAKLPMTEDEVRLHLNTRDYIQSERLKEIKSSIREEIDKKKTEED